jgi:hypothetical protein
MAIELSEEEMRKALFGASVDPVTPKATVPVVDTTSTPPIPSRAPRPKKTTGYQTSKLRVTLHASKVYDGEVDVFAHDSSSLSKLLAEQEAKAAAKKQNTNTWNWCLSNQFRSNARNQQGARFSESMMTDVSGRGVGKRRLCGKRLGNGSHSGE